MLHKILISLLAVPLVVINMATAQIPVEFETSEIINVNDFFTGSAPFTQFAEVAANSDVPELLITFIDVQATETDPISGQPSLHGLWGVFVNTNTFDKIGEPFFIFGTPDGGLERIASVYNPFSQQYLVGTVNIRSGGGDERGTNTPLMAVINPSDVSDPRVERTFEFDPGSSSSYQAIEFALDTQRGNIMMMNEYFVDFPGGGDKESVTAFLFDQDINLLSPLVPQDLDAFNQTGSGDVDNPHINYIASRDLYYVVWNTEDMDKPEDELYRRVGGRMIEPELDADGNLVLGDAAIISNPNLPNADDDLRETHPDVIDNPFTGNFITVYSTGGNDQGGFVSLTQVGDAPNYPITKVRELDEPYVAQPDVDTRVRQRQPEIALDENSGVFMVAMTVRNGNGNYVTDTLGLGGINIAFLGPDGNTLPPNTSHPNYVEGLPPAVYNATLDEFDTVNNQPHRFDIEYDVSSDSFIIVYEARESEFIKLVRVKVTSDHRPAAIEEWMLH